MEDSLNKILRKMGKENEEILIKVFESVSKRVKKQHEGFDRAIKILEERENEMKKLKTVCLQGGSYECGMIDAGEEGTYCLVDDAKRYRQSEIDKLKDLIIWMTGCGYDFSQHEYFVEQCDRLLKN